MRTGRADLALPVLYRDSLFDRDIEAGKGGIRWK